MQHTPPPMPPVREKACATLANLATEAYRSWILWSGPRMQDPCWIGSQRAGHSRPSPSKSVTNLVKEQTGSWSTAKI